AKDEDQLQYQELGTLYKLPMQDASNGFKAAAYYHNPLNLHVVCIYIRLVYAAKFVDGNPKQKNISL
ncbi:hypothetical protein, partial [Parasphingorhabdus sp.]|uniref:hypothetical protein n=1 Tax=Parasphingorhabdus sp. TaxID=2709688 RepID=UPI003296D14F